MTGEEAKQCVDAIRTEKRKADSPDLRAALKLLAEELNSKETHFILELLQNAEDNEYGGKEPELNLSIMDESLPGRELADGCFVMVNNEVGFQRENVQSLCSVGQSTKKERMHGYIGEKGIGFKSVFRITDSPHIFSNGFQFRFDLPTEEEGLGYILPHWVETLPILVKEGVTTVALPLQPGKRELISKQLLKIAPETVLFLRKIKCLKFGDGRAISRGGELPLVSLKGNEGESFYFVHGETWEKPDEWREDKRQGVRFREVSVTFPLEKGVACTGKVFAFLPTEFNSGLPFLINADFILNFNRERLLEDRRWNQWLRDQIAPTFVKAFLAILDNREWRSIASLFLPVESDLTPGSEFFLPVVEKTKALLQSERCILTDTGATALPGEVLFPGKKARELLQDVPKEKFKFALLNESWDADWKKRLEPLGVESLKFFQFFELCSDDAWLKSRGLEWWGKLLELCSSCNINAETIGGFPILLCQDGVPRSIASGIFLHAENQPDQGEFGAGWPPVVILNSELQKRLEQKPEVLKWLSDVAKIEKFSIETYVTGKLLVWMKSQIGETGYAGLVAASRFIAKNFSAFAKEGQERIKDRMPWVLRGKMILAPDQRGGRELILPECLESDAGWNLVFDGEADRRHFWVLSDEYFNGCPENGIPVLRQMMATCGANNHPAPAKELLPDGTVDWKSPGWLRDLNLEQPPPNLKEKTIALKSWIGKFRPESFERFLTCKHDDWRLDRGAVIKSSEFCEVLKNRQWLDSSKGLVCPQLAFIDDSEIRTFLGDSVPYVASNLPVRLLEGVGVGVRLTASTLIELLRQMRKRSTADKVLAVRIYQRLQTIEFNVSAFRDEPLVLLCVPKIRWENVNLVFWQDAGAVFDQEFGYACLTYEKDDLHGFFTSKLGMAEQPAAKEYGEVWAGMGSAASVEKSTVEAKLDVILPEVARAVVGVENRPDWWMRFRRRANVWTTLGRFEAKQSVFVPDDVTAESLFRECAKIAWVPAGHSFGRVNRLLREMGCLSLAERLRTSSSISEPVKPANLVKFLTQASKELLVCWVCRSEKWAEKKAELEMLLRTEEMTTPRIVIEHWLENDGSPKRLQDTAAFWNCSERRLYLRENATSKAQQAAVAASIAEKFARNDKEATDTVYRLLGLEPVDAEREKAERKWALSRSQEEWLSGLQIELQVLQLRTGKKRDRQNDGAEADDAGGGGKSKSGQPGAAKGEEKQAEQDSIKKVDETSKGGEAGSTKAAETDKRTAESTPPSKSVSETTEEKSEGGGHQTDDVEAPLKPQDTNVEFIEVSAHTRSQPRKRGVDHEEDNRREEKSSLGETSPKSKMDLEERAMQIIRHQFETNPELSGFTIRDCRKDLCGYDVQAEKPGHVLRIEIKAHGREAKSVFVTKREWDESRVKDSAGREDRWELWNVENLVCETAKTKITRYGNLPDDARSQEVGYWVNLNMCSR